MKRLIYFIVVVFVMGCNSSPDIKIFKNYKEGLENALQHRQKIFLIFDFWGNPTPSSERLIHDKEIASILRDYTIIFLRVDDPGEKGRYNRELQKTKFGTDTQPTYYILDANGNTIKGPQGYCKAKAFKNFIL